MNIQVKVKTKSNFNNLNDIWLDVIELVNTRVTVKYNNTTIDFNLKEVTAFNTIKNK